MQITIQSANFLARKIPRIRNSKACYNTLYAPIGRRVSNRIYCSFLVAPRKLTRIGSRVQKEKMESDILAIQGLLGVAGAPDDDYLSLKKQWSPGTREEFLSSQVVRDWRDKTSRCPKLLWVHARPGTGKSVLAAMVLQQLKAGQGNCSFFFFKCGDVNKRSLSTLLRSLALQVSLVDPDFRDFLCGLAAENLKVRQVDAREIWHKLFVLGLFKISFGEPLYWIIDALDESNSAIDCIDMLSAIPETVPIRILITSRETPAIKKCFEKARNTISVAEFCTRASI